MLSCTAALASPVTKGVEESKTFACWQALISAEGCIQDIFSSFFTGRMNLSPQCCHAIQSINQDCFLEFFPFFNPDFNPLLKSFCFTQSGAVPPSTV
ncbi:hypothetical protein QJS04_geneDACA008763 [Acorus gramineus]|uniref:Prolamin-like domain-containing protein n=1 Tax=Acorus gramineus TaxID=55184 RepID=A0AAV9ACN6_ACOGR|nr:hypothetical protein QJS04_geneDACA008763 [Acorus gramineus]